MVAPALFCWVFLGYNRLLHIAVSLKTRGEKKRYIRELKLAVKSGCVFSCKILINIVIIIIYLVPKWASFYFFIFLFCNLFQQNEWDMDFKCVVIMRVALYDKCFWKWASYIPRYTINYLSVEQKSNQKLSKMISWGGRYFGAEFSVRYLSPTHGHFSLFPRLKYVYSLCIYLRCI